MSSTQTGGKEYLGNDSFRALLGRLQCSVIWNLFLGIGFRGYLHPIHVSKGCLTLVCSAGAVSPYGLHQGRRGCQAFSGGCSMSLSHC